MRTTTRWMLACALMPLPATAGVQPGEAAAIDPALAIEPVASGLRHPRSIAFLPGGDCLVTEENGALLRVELDGERVGVHALRIGTRLRNVKQSSDGRRYVLTDAADGRLLRIVAAEREPNDDRRGD